VRRLDVVTTADTPIGDVHGDPQELADLVEVMDANGEPVPNEWRALLDEWRFNNEVTVGESLATCVHGFASGCACGWPDYLVVGEQFHLQGTANDHDQSTHAGGTATVLSPDDARQALLDNRRAAVAPEDAPDLVQAIGERGDNAVVDLTNLEIEGDPYLFLGVELEGRRGRGDMPQVPEPMISAFQAHLQETGVRFSPETIDPTTVRSTQTELDATKVGQMIAKVREGRFVQGHPPWVSNDDYILDGHHRWAVLAILEVAGEPRPPMEVLRVDLPIDRLLVSADEFNAERGVKAKTIEMAGYGEVVVFGYDPTGEFHLKGTATDHDQQTHAGGGTGGLKSPPEAPDGYRESAKAEWRAGHKWLEENEAPPWWRGTEVIADDGLPKNENEVAQDWEYENIGEQIDAFREAVGEDVASGVWMIGREAEGRRKHAIREAVSMNEISIEDAVERWGRFDAAPERGEWEELPDELFHATSALSAISESGVLLSRADVGGRDASAGLGGGDDNTISFTSDRKVAEDITRSLHEVRRAVAGSNDEVFDAIRERSGEWWEDVAGSAENVHGIKDAVPKTIEDRYNLWRTFAAFRERKEGVLDPLFFNVDPERLARMDPAEIGVVTVRPAVDSAKGYRVSSLGEWRVPTGRAVEIVATDLEEDPGGFAAIVEQFHLAGTVNDHDQSTHAGGGGGSERGEADEPWRGARPGNIGYGNTWRIGTDDHGRPAIERRVYAYTGWDNDEGGPDTESAVEARWSVDGRGEGDPSLDYAPPPSADVAARLSDDEVAAVRAELDAADRSVLQGVDMDTPVGFAVDFPASQRIDLSLSDSLILNELNAYLESPLPSGLADKYRPLLAAADMAAIRGEAIADFAITPESALVYTVGSHWNASALSKLGVAVGLGVDSDAYGYMQSATNSIGNNQRAGNPQVDYGRAKEIREALPTSLSSVTAAVNRHTQDVMSEMYPSGEVPVYRGVTRPAVEGEVSINPVSSWSLEAQWAANFGERTVKSTIPVESVFSYGAATGWGAQSEAEVILSTPSRTVRIDEVRTDRRWEFAADGLVNIDEGEEDWIKTASRTSSADEFHLEGQHDQRTHGRRYTAVGDLRDPDAGFTVDTVSLKPINTGFAVSILGSDRLILSDDVFDDAGEPSPRLVRLTRGRIEAARAIDTPDGTKLAVGAWHNPADGQIEVNVTVVFPSTERDRAFQFAVVNDQIAMADLDAISRGDWDNAIVSTGGTGGNRDIDDPIAASGPVEYGLALERRYARDYLTVYAAGTIMDERFSRFWVPIETMAIVKTELEPPTKMDGYVIRHELWGLDFDPNERPTEMHQAYTYDGAYIGSPEWAHELVVVRGITPELNRPNHRVVSVGFAEAEQKWYGWSHRAIFGFGIGDSVSEGDVIAESLPVGYVARTLDDARQMAAALAEGVS
jgi:hypothetical protein